MPGVPLATKAQRREHAEKQRQQKEDAAIVGPVVQIPLILGWANAALFPCWAYNSAPFTTLP